MDTIPGPTAIRRRRPHPARRARQVTGASSALTALVLTGAMAAGSTPTEVAATELSTTAAASATTAATAPSSTTTTTAKKSTTTTTTAAASLSRYSATAGTPSSRAATSSRGS